MTDLELSYAERMPSYCALATSVGQDLAGTGGKKIIADEDASA
jgi:hypothetical protein